MVKQQIIVVNVSLNKDNADLGDMCAWLMLIDNGNIFVITSVQIVHVVVNKLYYH